MRREEDVLISVAEAASILDVNPATVWRYIQLEDDPLPAQKVGRSWALWQSDVVAFKPKAKRTPGPKPGRERRRTCDLRYPLAGDVATHKLCADR
jgi:hypothetical protein